MLAGNRLATAEPNASNSAVAPSRKVILGLSNFSAIKNTLYNISRLMPPGDTV
jgi:hypothetical protein